jgi:phosphotransferase system HPr (HPr) family protein
MENPMRQAEMFVFKTEHAFRARPAAELVYAARAFKANIVAFGSNGRSANAKSVLSLLQLDAAKGTELTITANGVDAAEALFAIRQVSYLYGLEPQPYSVHSAVVLGHSQAFVAGWAPDWHDMRLDAA